MERMPLAAGSIKIERELSIDRSTEFWTIEWGDGFKKSWTIMMKADSDNDRIYASATWSRDNLSTNDTENVHDMIISWTNVMALTVKGIGRMLKD